jgi:hypothetical protein
MNSRLTVQSTAIARGDFAVLVMPRSPRQRRSRAARGGGYHAARGWLDRLLFWIIG